MDLLVPDYAHSALIIIDYQNDCILPGAPFEIAGSYDVLPKLQELVKHVRESDMPVIHVVRAYLPDGSNVDLCRRRLVQNGAVLFQPHSEGIDFPEELKPEDKVELDWNQLINGEFQQIGSNDWVMYKSRWGAFYRTGLEAFLREKKVNTLIFSGCNFPNCPRTSIYEASERDFRIVLAADAMSGLYKRGIQELENIGVAVTKTEDICNYI